MPHRLVVDSAEEGAEMSVTEGMVREADEAEGRMRSAVAEILRSAQVCPGLSASPFFRSYITGGAVFDFSPHEVVAFMAHDWSALLRSEGEAEKERLFDTAVSAVHRGEARWQTVMAAADGFDMVFTATRLMVDAALRASDG
jgi:hypothetical protein